MATMATQQVATNVTTNTAGKLAEAQKAAQKAVVQQLATAPNATPQTSGINTTKPTNTTQPTQAISMTDYANQIMDQRAQTAQQQSALGTQLANANKTVGTVNRESLASGALGNQDPLSKEARSKLTTYEQLISSQPAAYDPMRWAEGESIARSRIDPIYQQQVAQTLNDSARQAVKTGFYGQIPAEQMKQNALAAVEAQRTSDTFNSALDLMSKSNADRQTAYQNRYQAYRDQVGDVLNDYHVTVDAYDSDYTKWLQNEQFKWDKDYQQQTLDLDKWYKESQQALAKTQQDIDYKIALANLTGDIDGQRTLAGQAQDNANRMAALQEQYQRAQIAALNASTASNPSKTVKSGGGGGGVVAPKTPASSGADSSMMVGGTAIPTTPRRGDAGGAEKAGYTYTGIPGVYVPNK